MGMFDSFMGYWRCPDCHKSSEIEVQTKQLDNRLARYHTGDVVYNSDHPQFGSNYILIESVWCPNCSYRLDEDEESGLVLSRLKDEWIEHVVHIIIEDNLYKEMVFTGEKKKIGPFEPWPSDNYN